ncbi:MAG TPA: pyridoxal 5'-phosphate synthase glutaminase subunit PdxT [Acidimicrobiales bacterium]|nr:pyridoxal 5'-phosphate synthase glutaminase subunit PdxT [Acidimicrobiales bacterium]
MPATVGVVALQGAFRRHAEVLDELGVTAVEVRTPDDLRDVDAVVLPGGESTTMTALLDSAGLREPLSERIGGGLPALGTCAGMILLASEVLDGRPDQVPLGAIDLSVRRNAFGRQRESFEVDLDVADLPGGPLPAIFIRAPLVTRVGPGVEVLAEVDDGPVLCRSGTVTVASFHPELGEDRRLHERFLKEI